MTPPLLALKTRAERDSSLPILPILHPLPCNDVDLKIRTLGQRRNPHSHSRRIGRAEKCGTGVIDRLKGGEIGQIEGQLHDIGGTVSRLGEHGPEALKDESGLGRNSSRNDSSSGLEGDLP